MASLSAVSQHQPDSKHSGLSLATFFTRWIWLCMLPLLILAVWLAVDSVRTTQSERDMAAGNMAKNFATTIDNYLDARIAALNILAASPLLDDASRWEDLYREALGFYGSFGSHVVLADIGTPMRMLFNTRVPFGTELPLLPRPDGQAAAPTAVKTGKPAVGDPFFGPIADEPLVAIAVPVMREGKAAFLLLTVMETSKIRARLDQVALPAGWSLTLTDSSGKIIADHSVPGQDSAQDSDGAKRFVVDSAVSPWSVVLKIPGSVYWKPIFAAITTLGAGILCALLISLLCGAWVGRRLGHAVASLAETPSTEAHAPEIIEVAEARRQLDEEAVKRATVEAALRQSEERLRLFIEHAPVAIAMFDREMRYLAVSRRWVTDYRIKSQDLIGRSHYEVFPEIPDRWKEAHQKGLRGEVIKADEDAFLRSDGTKQWLRWVLQPWYTNGKSIGGIVIFTEDITEHKRTREALGESRQVLEGIMNAIPVRVFWKDKHLVYLGCNQAFALDAGFQSPQEIIGKDDYAMGWREHAELYRGDDRQVIESGKPKLMIEEPQTTPEGNTITLLTSKIPLLNSKGEISGVLGTYTDITELKRKEDDLRESEERFRLSFENANIGMCLVDTSGKLIKVNRQMCDIFGYSQAELEGMTVNDIAHPDYQNVSPTFMRRAQDREIEHTEFEKAYIHKQGHLVWGHVASSLVRNTSGEPMYFISHVVDITTRKKAELELRQSEEHYRVLVEVSSEAMLLRDEQGKIIYGNPSAIKLLRASKKEDLLGLDYLEIVHPEDREESARRFSRSLQENTPVPWREHRLMTLDGQVAYVESTGIPLESGGRRNVLGIFHDLTERKRLEEDHNKMEAQVRQSQKMEAVGRLAGGVAHDFNNMLGVIIGYSELAISKLPADDSVQEYLSEIKLAAQRSADITRQLLAFARRQTISPKVLDLNDTIEGMLKMLRRLIGEDIDLLWKPAQSIWPVKMDPAQIDQILANLTVNARDAISGVGKIIIETENKEFDLKYCESHTGFIPGKFSMLAVSDNGHGMDKETLEKLFEPFFTTKKEGEGTGLGLATVYGIVKQNNGFINVYSEPGHGTTFKIYLPRQDAEAGEIDHLGVYAEAATGTETILLVEDEESLLKFTKILMEDLGYRVLVASSPQEAIQLSRGYAGEIHLLMTDVVMPEMNGRDLGIQIEAIRPGIKCLFMSGYTANVIAHRGVLNEGVHFIQKPFSRETLARKLRETLS